MQNDLDASRARESWITAAKVGEMYVPRPAPAPAPPLTFTFQCGATDTGAAGRPPLARRPRPAAPSRRQYPPRPLRTPWPCTDYSVVWQWPVRPSDLCCCGVLLAVRESGDRVDDKDCATRARGLALSRGSAGSVSQAREVAQAPHPRREAVAAAPPPPRAIPRLDRLCYI